MKLDKNQLVGGKESRQIAYSWILLQLSPLYFSNLLLQLIMPYELNIFGDFFKIIFYQKNY